MSLKIAISGTEGSGKTTLTELLAEEPLSLSEGICPFVLAEEGAEDLIREFSEYVKDDPQLRKLLDPKPIEVLAAIRRRPALKLKFQWELMERRALVETRHNFVVSDRTHIDGATYTLAYLMDKVPQEDLAAYLRRAVELTRRNYDMIFLLPTLLFPPEDNGIRRLEPTYLRYMGALLRGLYQEFEIEVREIRENGPSLRRAEVEKALRVGPFRRRN